MIIETPYENLSEIMHYVNSAYTTYTNIKRKRVGHLFQGRYRAIVVDKDSYLLELSRYLHLNPVRAKMVEKPEDYSFSSYRSYILNDKDEIVTNATILGMLAKENKEARKLYKAFVESALGAELENPLSKVYGGVIIGNDEFISEVLSRIEINKLDVAEIAHHKKLMATVGTEELISDLCRHYGIAKDEITKGKRCEGRKAGIYLMKKYTAASNSEIGAIFGNLSYSAVAKTYQNFAKQMELDEGLRARIKGFLAQNSITKV